MLGWRVKLQGRGANRVALPLNEAERRFLRAVAKTLQHALNAESVILCEASPEVVL
jgi:hypothetical protein